MINVSRRNLSLDIFKGLGIVYMIIGHQIVWLFTYGDGYGLQYPNSYHVFLFFRIGLHPLVLQLPVIAGACLWFSMRSKNISLVAILQRSCVLIFLGFLLNYISWGPIVTFAWDVLPFIGLSTIVSYGLIKNFSRPYIPFCLAAIAISCLALANQFPFSQYRQFYLYKIFFGDPAGENYWPFCPWYALFAAGIFLGRALESNRRPSLRSLQKLGIAFLGIYLLSELRQLTPYFTDYYDYQNVWGTLLFKPSSLFVLGIMGFSLFFIPLLHQALERSSKIKNALARSWLVMYAQGILWIYLITVSAGYRVTELLKSALNPIYQEALLLLPLLVGADLLLAYAIAYVVTFKKKAQYP